jgi:hypothetical protein
MDPIQLRVIRVRERNNHSISIRRNGTPHKIHPTSNNPLLRYLYGLTSPATTHPPPTTTTHHTSKHPQTITTKNGQPNKGGFSIKVGNHPKPHKARRLRFKATNNKPLFHPSQLPPSGSFP